MNDKPDILKDCTTDKYAPKKGGKYNVSFTIKWDWDQALLRVFRKIFKRKKEG